MTEPTLTVRQLRLDDVETNVSRAIKDLTVYEGI
jgi:hypothetical protein